jgi:hypothetical protein
MSATSLGRRGNVALGAIQGQCPERAGLNVERTHVLRAACTRGRGRTEQSVRGEQALRGAWMEEGQEVRLGTEGDSL